MSHFKLWSLFTQANSLKSTCLRSLHKKSSAVITLMTLIAVLSATAPAQSSQQSSFKTSNFAVQQPVLAAENGVGSFLSISDYFWAFFAAPEVSQKGDTNYADKQDFNLTEEFTGDLSRSSPFSYGYISENGGFTILDQATENAFDTVGLIGRSSKSISSLGIFKNTNRETNFYSSVQQPADMLNLHPGANGERSTIRYSASIPGTYHITGKFVGLDANGTTSDVQIISHSTQKDSEKLFVEDINGFNNEKQFNLSVVMAANETLEFSVGSGNNKNSDNDSTGFNAVIKIEPAVSKEDIIVTTNAVGDITSKAASPNILTSVTVDPTTGLIYAQQDQGSTAFYRYDPVANSWTTLASSPVGSGNNGGAAYLNGKIYTSYTSSNPIGVYDIASNSWTTVANPTIGTGNITSEGGFLYLAVGTSFVRFNPSTNTTTTLATPPFGFERWGGLEPFNGFIYGHQGNGTTGFAKYDIANNMWTSLPNVPGGAVLGSAIDPVGKVYYAYGTYSGTNFYRFDLVSQTWSTITFPLFGNFLDGGMAYVSQNGVVGVYIVQGESGTGFGRLETAPAVSTVNVSIGDASTAEGGTAAFTVTLSSASASDVTFNASTADITATSGDYTALVNQPVTILTGQTTTTINVVTTDDLIVESAETFNVVLSNPSSNAVITDGTGEGTITDNDVAPSVTINQAAGQNDPTYSSTINFTAVFDEPVSDFDDIPGDVIQSGTATVSGVVISQVGPMNGTTYNIAITVTSSGTVIPSIPANAATDGGAGNNPSTSTDNTVTYIVPPTENLYALTNGSPQRLVQFSSTATGTPLSSVAINNLQAGEKLLGIDFRPATGQLYGLGSTNRLYRINTVTGLATQVGAAGAFTLTGTNFGFDFNPVPDRIRVVSNTGQNIRLNPNDGTLAGTDTPLNPGTPTVTAAAYTNNVSGATTTTLYDIDSNTDTLVRQGGVGVPPGTPSPNGGSLTTIGALGVNADNVNGFDISGTTQTAYAAFSFGGADKLYVIDLTNGSASDIGNIASVCGPLCGIAGLTASPVGGAMNFPEVVSINRLTPAGPNTNADSVVFRVTFSEPVENVDRTDFRIVSTGLTTPAEIGTVTGLSGGVIYDVQLINYVGEGTLGLNLFDDGTITSVAGNNPLSGPGQQNPGGFNFVGQVYNIDNVDPTVLSSSPANANPTSALSVNFTVTFSEPVMGVNAADFTTRGTVGGTPTVTNVTPSSTTSSATYTVTVSGYSGGGTLFLDVSDDDSIVDGFGNTLAAPFTATEFYTINAMPTVTITANPASANEGNTATNERNFDITLSGTSNQEIVVNYSTSNGSATAGSDYVAETGSVTFAASTTTLTQTISITVNGDMTFETNETFTVTLTSSDPDVTVSTTNGAATATIVNDDARPVISINDITANEGSIGSTPFTFTVSLSNASDETVTVGVATADVTATSPSDYTAIPATTLTFAPGEPLTQTVTVNVNGDGAFEQTETFDVVLSSQTNSILEDANPGVGTIANDDTAPIVTITDATVTETDAGTVNAVFDVNLTGSTNLTTIVNFATANGTATAGLDYVANSGTLTFPAGAGPQTQQVTVVVNSDNLDEASETFFVNLTLPTGATNATIGDPQGVGTILNDDFPEVLSINRLTPAGSNTTGSSVVFRVTFTEPVQDVDATDFVIVRTGTVTGGTITSFVSNTGAQYDVTISGFMGTGTLGLNLIDDGTIDRNGFQLSGPGLQNPGGFNFVGQIYNVDNIAPTVVSSSPANANPTNAFTVDFTVTFNEPVTGVNAADFTTRGTVGGTPTVTNVTPSSTTSSATYTVTVSGYSGGGTLFLDVNNDDTATPIVDGFGNLLAADFTATEFYTINAPPTVSINSVSVAEGNTGTTDARFTVSLTAPSNQPITVQAQTADGTATVADDDYESTVFVNIAQGKTATQSSTSFGGDASRAVDGNINGNYNANSVSHTGEFLGTNTPASTTGESQPYLDVDLGSDQAIDRITLWNRTDCCSDRLSYFYVFVSDTPFTTGASVNDTLAQSGVTSSFVNQNGSGIVKFDVPVTTGTSGRYVRVQIDSTNPLYPMGGDIPVSGTFLSLAELEVLSPAGGTTPSTITFAPGETSKTLTVLVNGDTKLEDDETFTVTLTAMDPDVMVGRMGIGTGTIVNDDAIPAASIGNATVTEGNTGNTAATFTVTLSNPSENTITINVVTADGTATAGSDYSATPIPATLTFDPGETSKTVTVNVLGDVVDETNETFFVNITSADANATISDGEGLGTITDDDGATTITVDDASVTEGNAGTTNLTFTVTKTGATQLPVTVNYTTTDGTAIGGAMCGAGVDYVNTGGQITIAAAAATSTIQIPVCGDVVDEINEAFTITITSNDANATGTDTATGTITDDDAAAIISVADSSVTEGNSGTSAITFTVTKSGNATSLPATINYMTTDGTATGGATCIAGVDYITPTDGQITIAAAASTGTFDITVCGDNITEIDEAFTVTITSNDVNATVGDGTAIGTISNDDATPTVSIAAVSTPVAEGATGVTTPTTFTVSLSNPSSAEIVVNYATAPGADTATTDPATAGSDYTTAGSTLTFAPGETSKTVTVNVLGDNADENDETFDVTLTETDSDVTLGTATATQTITDDDASPIFTVDDITLSEGSTPPAGTTAFTFTVTLTGESNLATSVDYTTADGTTNPATAGTDYIAIPTTTLNFAAGVAPRTQQVTVSVNKDNIVELDETFFVNLTNAVGATIGDAQGLGTITNDDAFGSLQFSSATYSGTEPGTISVTVTRTGGSAQAVSVNYATSDGTATAATGDYTPASGTLNFADGETSKSFNITVLNDVFGEGNETILLALSGVSGGATLGTPNMATATILANDGGSISISGTVRQYIAPAPGDNMPTFTPLAGVTVTLSGSQSGSTTTDTNGNYTFNNLNGNVNNFVVTPSLATPPKVFEPRNRSYNDIAVNQTSQDFIAYDANAIPRILKVGNGFTNPGQAVNIPITLTGFGNETDIDFSLNYDNTRLLGTPTVTCSTPGITPANTGGTNGCSIIVVTTPTAVGIQVNLTTPLGTVGIVNEDQPLVTVTFSSTAPTSGMGSLIPSAVTFGSTPTARSTSNSSAEELPTAYASGNVFFAGFESDLATRFGGDGMILANDVVLVRQFVAGTLAFNPMFDEFRRTDAAPRGLFGDGCILANDIVQARRYAAGLDRAAGGAPRPAAGPTVQLTAAECETAGFAQAKTATANAIPRVIRVVNTTATTGGQVLVTIQLDAEGNEAGLGFTLNYDQTKLSSPVVTVAPGGTGGIVTTNPENSTTATNKLGIVLDGGAIGNGTRETKNILTVRFNVASTATLGGTDLFFDGSLTPRSVSDNQGNLVATNYNRGTVTISAGPTAATATIGGRVVTASGKSVNGATVTLTDSVGNSVKTRTNAKGVYRFDEIPTGATYVINVSTRFNAGTSQVVNLVDSLANLDFILQE